MVSGLWDRRLYGDPGRGRHARRLRHPRDFPPSRAGRSSFHRERGLASHLWPFANQSLIERERKQLMKSTKSLAIAAMAISLLAWSLRLANAQRGNKLIVSRSA